MKKLVLIISLFAAFLVTANAQVIRLSQSQVYETYTHSSTTDTIAGTTEKTFDIFVNKDYLYYYEIQATLDSLGDGTDITVRAKGSNDESNWYNVGSAVTWGVSSSTDTVIRLQNIPDAETWAIGSYNIYHDYDTSAGGNSIVNDTATVAAQTYTITKDFPVGWRYLRLSCTGGGAGAGGDLVTLTVAIRKAQDY